MQQEVDRLTAADKSLIEPEPDAMLSAWLMLLDNLWVLHWGCCTLSIRLTVADYAVDVFLGGLTPEATRKQAVSETTDRNSQQG